MVVVDYSVLSKLAKAHLITKNIILMWNGIDHVEVFSGLNMGT